MKIGYFNIILLFNKQRVFLIIVSKNSKLTIF